MEVSVPYAYKLIRRMNRELEKKGCFIMNGRIVGSSDMDMVAEIQKKIDLVNADKRSRGKRVLRHDAVTGMGFCPLTQRRSST